LNVCKQKEKDFKEKLEKVSEKMRKDRIEEKKKEKIES